MCDMCGGLTETIRIEHPYEYFNIISQVKTLIREGSITLEQSNCKLEDVEKGKPFPDDILYHVFKCTYCGQMFELCVETYHGSGGNWKVLNR